MRWQTYSEDDTKKWKVRDVNVFNMRYHKFRNIFFSHFFLHLQSLEAT